MKFDTTIDTLSAHHPITIAGGTKMTLAPVIHDTIVKVQVIHEHSPNTWQIIGYIGTGIGTAILLYVLIPILFISARAFITGCKDVWWKNLLKKDAVLRTDIKKVPFRVIIGLALDHAQYIMAQLQGAKLEVTYRKRTPEEIEAFAKEHQK